MLAGLSALELGRLRMSVGYGTHKKGRPLSPIEVGRLLRRAREEGATLEDCAKTVHLDGTGHIGRFLRILDLPEDLQHLIDWGAGKNFVGFTSAVELVKIGGAADRRIVAEAILSHGLNSREIRQAAQLRRRSGRAIEACLAEVLDMRTKVERRYVFMGSVAEESVEALRDLTQAARDAILASGISRLKIRSGAARLGSRFFTLVGDERFNASMQEVGKENIETGIRSHIVEAVGNESSG